MNRRWIFAALGALWAARKAQGQQWKECVPEKHGDSDFITICSDKMKPAKPNQCPVCGTMAEPYVRPMAAHFTAEGPKDMPYGPKEHVARCKRCSCAFWQDAEK